MARTSTFSKDYSSQEKDTSSQMLEFNILMNATTSRKTNVKWIIENSSIVRAVDEPEPPALPPIFAFTSFQQAPPA